jgi:crossover junction endodeoxyribonuclease RuvC
MSAVRVLGIDPGITHLGLGAVAQEGQAFTLLHAELVETRPEEPASQRVGRIYRAVLTALRDHQLSAIAVEEQFFYRQNELAYKVGWAMGGILVAADQLGLPVYGYGPMQVKQSLVGYGRAEKEQVAYMVRRLLQLHEAPRVSHITDALAIALTHCFHARHEELLR